MATCLFSSDNPILDNATGAAGLCVPNRVSKMA